MAEDTGRQDSDGQTSTPHRSRREARTFETSESYTDTLGDVFGDEVFDDDVFDDDAFAVEISRLSQFDQPVRGTHTYTSLTRPHRQLPRSPSMGDWSAPELLANRLSHLGRRLEELHQCEINRFAEERHETWILVFALSVVLVFCFAAFFMNQMEVRELRTGLEESLDRRASETVAAIETTVANLHLDRIPKLKGSIDSIEDLITENERHASGELKNLFASLKAGREANDSRLDERLVQVEAQLECLLRMSRDIRGQAFVAAGVKANGDAKVGVDEE